VRAGGGRQHSRKHCHARRIVTLLAIWRHCSNHIARRPGVNGALDLQEPTTVCFEHRRRGMGGPAMFRVSIVSLALVALIAPASAFDLLVINDSKYAIRKLHVAPAKSKKWGDDKLQGNSIGPNGRFTVRNIPAGAYDMKVIDEDDDTCVASNINVDRDKEWAFTNSAIENCEGDDD
jgi:hypothetical protein